MWCRLCRCGRLLSSWCRLRGGRGRFLRRERRRWGCRRVSLCALLLVSMRGRKSYQDQALKRMPVVDVVKCMVFLTVCQVPVGETV